MIIRFSSWGDVVQCLSLPSIIQAHYPTCEIHWITRSDYAHLLENHPQIQSIWTIDPNDSVFKLITLAFSLRKQKFTHIYDAHNNLRSHILSFLLLTFSHTKFIKRSKDRIKRFLLFHFKINLFPKPYKAQFSYMDPLSTWGIRSLLPSRPQLYFSKDVIDKVHSLIQGLPPFICLVPSAAWNMKRWPKEHWKTLITLLSKEFFVILGGPKDLFCNELREIDPGRVVNFTTQLSQYESAAVLSKAQLVIAADTGLLHIADQLGVPTIALIGPTAFGYPSRTSTQVLEVPLKCRPCSKDGRGTCSNSLYKRCMIEITPQIVAESVNKLINEASSQN